MGEIIVRMSKINKSFAGVRVLKDVDFTLEAGEVMALLGENGAGKSTLMKILSGAYTRDAGELEVFGQNYGNIDTNKAQAIGVAIIHQELNMCKDLTVAENIFLGRELRKGSALDNRTMNRLAKEALQTLNVELDPETIVGTLSVSQQQIVEIAKALSTQAKILIMDEPTSSLSSKEIEELFKIITRMKNNNCGIVYISHRLEELHHIVDSVTVLRDGEFVMKGKFADYTIDQLISSMVGRDIEEKFPRDIVPVGKTIFAVKNLSAGPLVKNISFEVKEGEVLGIAGLMGAGRTELTRAIFGVDKVSAGEVWLDGKKLQIRKPSDAIKAGVALIPEDRKKDGLCVKLSVKDNITLPNLDWLSNYFGVVNRKREKENADTAKERFQIKLASLEANAETLSGGNQQKVVVAKWLSKDARVVIFDEPTRGIDVGSKVEIYQLINQLKKSAVAVVIVSSELPEIMGISDRIIVMCDGRITGNVMSHEASEDLLLSYAMQFETKI